MRTPPTAETVTRRAVADPAGQRSQVWGNRETAETCPQKSSNSRTCRLMIGRSTRAVSASAWSDFSCGTWLSAKSNARRQDGPHLSTACSIVGRICRRQRVESRAGDRERGDPLSSLMVASGAQADLPCSSSAPSQGRSTGACRLVRSPSEPCGLRYSGRIPRWLPLLRYRRLEGCGPATSGATSWPGRT